LYPEKGEKAVARIIGEGITFDDVLLQPAYSEVIGNQIDISTYLTKNIKLNSLIFDKTIYENGPKIVVIGAGSRS